MFGPVVDNLRRTRPETTHGRQCAPSRGWRPAIRPGRRGGAMNGTGVQIGRSMPGGPLRLGRGTIKIYDNLKQRVTCGFPWQNRVNTPFCLHSSVIVRGDCKLFGFHSCWARIAVESEDPRGFPSEQKEYMNRYPASRKLLK